MATVPDHRALLDQLQSQVNIVLERTGRVFAAVNTDPKTPPKAQIAKLKQVLPLAQDRFQEALDQLETELQLAQLVMRRDLALCREREGHGASGMTQTQPAMDLSTPSASNTGPPEEEIEVTMPVDETPVHFEMVAQPKTTAQPNAAVDEDLEMEELTPNDTTTSPKDSSWDTEMADTAAAEGSAAGDEDQRKAHASAKEISTEEVKPAETTKPTETTLQLDTDSQVNPSSSEKLLEDEKAPDTAQESNTGDLESLFGGGTDNNDFSFDQTNPSEIDFGDFGTNFSADNGDNDNISSLLPGLEDYANTQPTGAGEEIDLNTFFNNNGEGQGGAMNQQSNGEQRDTTFDDLMDLANFDTTGMDDGDNPPSTFEFDSLFQ